MILAAFRRAHHARNIAAFYGAIVAQARSAAFYTAYGVADTLEGRFELIVLHLALVVRRLEGADNAGRMTGQGLFDAFCRDLDHNLREMGTGDLAVPREMRRFAEAFYGRHAAYRAALAASTDPRELEKALARNIFGLADVDDKAARLARYVRAMAEGLDAADTDVLVAGKAVFPSPEAFAHG